MFLSFVFRKLIRFVFLKLFIKWIFIKTAFKNIFSINYIKIFKSTLKEHLIDNYISSNAVKVILIRIVGTIL